MVEGITDLYELQECLNSGEGMTRSLNKGGKNAQTDFISFLLFERLNG